MPQTNNSYLHISLKEKCVGTSAGLPPLDPFFQEKMPPTPTPCSRTLTGARKKGSPHAKAWVSNKEAPTLKRGKNKEAPTLKRGLVIRKPPRLGVGARDATSIFFLRGRFEQVLSAKQVPHA